MITCPACRDVTSLSQVKDDFRLNSLIKVYKSKKQLSGDAEAETYQTPCQLCEMHYSLFYCQACMRTLCNTCQVAHIKTTDCKLEQGERLGDRLASLRQNLQERMVELKEWLGGFKVTHEDTIEASVKSANECLERLEFAEFETIRDVKKWYSRQKDLVSQISDQKIQDLTKKGEEMVFVAEQMMCDMESLKHDAERLLAEHQSIQALLDRHISSCKREDFMSLSMELKNQTEHAFDMSKALALEGFDIFPDNLDNEENSGFLESLPTQTLTVEKLAEIPGYIYKLQIVDDQIWALRYDCISVLSHDGSLVNTLKAGFTDALDMCVVQEHVIVATRCSGLLQLTPTGKLIGCLDDGTCLSVTRDDNKSFWAVKEVQKATPLWICKFMYCVVSGKFKIFKKLQTDLKLGYNTVRSVLLNDVLYISSYNTNGVFAVSTKDGGGLAQYDTSCLDSAGDLARGCTALHSEPLSQALLVTNSGENPLHIIDVKTGDWRQVRTAGAELEFPTAAVTDTHQCLWLASELYPAKLYKGTL